MGIWHTTAMSETHQVDIQEACRLLNVSRSTVLRRIQSGQLTGQKVSGKWLVDIPENAQTDTTAGSADLLSRMTMLEQERAFLSAQVEQLQEDKRYLQDALAREQMVSASIRQLLPEQATVTQETQPPVDQRAGWLARLRAWIGA